MLLRDLGEISTNKYWDFAICWFRVDIQHQQFVFGSRFVGVEILLKTNKLSVFEIYWVFCDFVI